MCDAVFLVISISFDFQVEDTRPQDSDTSPVLSNSPSKQVKKKVKSKVSKDIKQIDKGQADQPSSKQTLEQEVDPKTEAMSDSNVNLITLDITAAVDQQENNQISGNIADETSNVNVNESVSPVKTIEKDSIDKKTGVKAVQQILEICFNVLFC